MERKQLLGVFLAMAVLYGLSPVAWAQRGMGDDSGVVRQGLRPATVTLQGTVVRVIIGPCEKGTGRSDIGTHFVLKTEQGQEQNIHLGPVLVGLLVITLKIIAFFFYRLPPIYLFGTARCA